MQTDTVAVEQALLPCPFCGGAGEMIHPMGYWRPGGYGPDGSRIRCTSGLCATCTVAFYGPDQDAQAITAWNTRLAALQHPGGGALDSIAPTALHGPTVEACIAAIRDTLFPKNERSDWTPYAQINAGCCARAEEALRRALLIAAGEKPKTYAEFQQRRGRLPDLIEEALSIYSGFMADDDYNAQGCLDRIAEKLRSARDWYDRPPLRSTAEAGEEAKMLEVKGCPTPGACSCPTDRYAEVVALVVGAQKASPSFVQRTLDMGWGEAMRYFDQMEREGIVSPISHGVRQVLRATPPADLTECREVLEVCPDCSGRGVIETGQMEKGPGGWGFETVDCSTCRTTGKKEAE